MGLGLSQVSNRNEWDGDKVKSNTDKNGIGI